jgi:hypothetical protein
MIYGVQRKVLYVWVVWCLVALAKAQMGEEPVRKAERVEEEVRSAEAVEETVRRADLAEKPKSESALGRLFSNTPKVKIESPQDGQVMPWETVDVFVRVDQVTIEEDGHRVHVILDNGSPIEHTNVLKPVILRGLAPGAHTVRVFVVKPDGKMLPHPESFARTDFYVRRQDFSNFQPVDRPYLTVNLPKDGVVNPDADGKVWLDFLTHQAPLAKDKYRVKAVMSGVETIVSTRDPHPWAGLAEGRHRVVIELIDEDGDPVSEIFARVERTFEISRVVRAVNPKEADSANLWLRRER